MRTILDLVGVAGRGVFLEFWCAAAVVGWAVASHLVQYNHAIAFQTVDIVVQFVQQHVVHTDITVAILWQLHLRHIHVWHSVAGAFTTTVVFTPQYADPGMCQYVEHAFLMASQSSVIIFTRHVGEHARH
ncbi:hypothetical protein D3C79_901690 [compost metagenome]